MSIKNKSAIVGIGQTEFSKGLGRTELSIAIEACKKAVADAGMSTKDIDGIVRFDIDNAQETDIAYALGIPELHFFATTPMGGGAGANSIQLAAMAVATGQANNVIAYRSRNRGKQSAGRTGGAHAGGRPWEKQSMEVSGAGQYHIPFGLVSPVQPVGLRTRRHMHAVLAGSMGGFPFESHRAEVCPGRGSADGSQRSGGCLRFNPGYPGSPLAGPEALRRCGPGYGLPLRFIRLC